VTAGEWGQVVVGFLAGIGVHGLVAAVLDYVAERSIRQAIRVARDAADDAAELLEHPPAA
jgi:hypothetical protein